MFGTVKFNSFVSFLGDREQLLALKFLLSDTDDFSPLMKTDNNNNDIMQNLDLSGNILAMT